jgi:hypothetical protein
MHMFIRKCYYKFAPMIHTFNSYACSLIIQFIFLLATHKSNTKFMMGVFSINYRQCEDRLSTSRAKAMIGKEISGNLVPFTKNLE